MAADFMIDETRLGGGSEDYVYGDEDVRAVKPMALMRHPEPLSEDEVKNIVEAEIGDALGGLGSQISQERLLAQRYYHGRAFGNEVDGRSKVVLTDVADTIEWIMPSLMRMFTGGQYIARYLPRGVDDIDGAEQATEYINANFMGEINGFQLLHDWFKDALMSKNGITKTYYEEKYEPRRQTYRGLTGPGVQKLLEDKIWEPVAFEENPDGTFNIVVMQAAPRGMIKIDLVPPEEFVVARRMIKLNDDLPFAAHRKKMMISDLIAMGFPVDMVLELSGDDTPEYAEERIERLSEDESYPVSRNERLDPASREVWVTECYMRIDEDGDGYSELRKIIVVGGTAVDLLLDHEINWQPFTSITPVPIPHKFYGLSIADQVMDLQLIRSTLLRQMLDNMYLVNNGRYGVVDGMVEIDDLLTSRPGGVVRMTAPGMIEALPTQPFNQSSFQLMEFLEQVRTMRTGAGMHSQGLDASSLANTTATAMTQHMAAAYARIELIARIFSEGVKDLFKKQLKLMVENPVRNRVIKMRGEWVEIDPSSWNIDMDVQVEVGLGVGQAGERIQYLGQVLQIQEAMAMKGLDTVTQQNVYNTSVKLVEAMGLRNPDMFFTDPQDKQASPPPDPDAETDKLAIRQKDEESKRRERDNEDRLKLDTEKLKIDVMERGQMAQHREAELQQKAQDERNRLESQERVAQIQANTSIAIARINAENRSQESAST